MQPYLLVKFFYENSLDMGKFYYIWAKSKSCIPKNIRSHTAMILEVRLKLWILLW